MYDTHVNACIEHARLYTRVSVIRQEVQATNMWQEVNQGEVHLGSNVQAGFCWVVGSSIGARLAPYNSLQRMCRFVGNTKIPAPLKMYRSALIRVVQLQHTCSAGQCCLCLWRVASSATVSSAGWSPDSRRLANVTCVRFHMCFCGSDEVCL